jgi:hypothetical protein
MTEKAKIPETSVKSRKMPMFPIYFPQKEKSPVNH